MHMHLVDGQENTVSVEVDDPTQARQMFDEMIKQDPWVGACLYDDDGFLSSLVRITEPADTHPLVTPDIISRCLEARSEVRRGETSELAKWAMPGFCHEVSEFIQYEFGFARTSGTIMARDLINPICLHYWNVLPDLSILDMTFDQLYEGADYRIIAPDHPDWCRYQPEYEYVDDLESIRGKGVYPDELIDFIQAQAPKIEPLLNSNTLKRHQQALPADEHLRSSIKPMLVQYTKAALKENAGFQKAYQKQDEDSSLSR